VSCGEGTTSAQIHRRPSLPRNPRRVDAVRLVNVDVHYVAPSDDFEAAIGHVAIVDSKEDG
jgi:hypothetical protein